ncbi:15197_t:CDS:2, partial [Funneliformis caledonium]
MSFYTRCVYAASTRANDSEIPTPTDKELAWMHTESPEVCWIVKNPDLSLSTPNLVDIDNNQSFNCLKLNYTEKKTDYPKLFRARHVLSVIHNNNGFIELQRKIRVA